MKIRVSWLWILLAGVVAYDLAVTALGFFPNRGLDVRLDVDARIAWFIFSAWISHKLAAPTSDEAAV